MSLFRYLKRASWDEERARELEAHLAIETDEQIARGLSADEARMAARRKLGNLTRVREDIYHFNTIGALEQVWRDVRYGARVLRLNPGFTCVAVLSLALGVGANTAIFQLLDAVRLRTLPVTHPEQLAEVRITATNGFSGAFMGSRPMLTNALWERIRDRQEAFSSAFAWSSTDFELSRGGDSRPAEGLWVSGGFLATLGVHPRVGRVLTDADDQRGCATPPAVISDAFWQREYGGDPSAVGRTLTLDGYPFHIVGVTPPSFFGVEVGRRFDVAVPLCAEPHSRGARSALHRKDAWFLASIGRLKPGWTVEKAAAHLGAISAPIFADTLPTYTPEERQSYLAFLLAAYPAGTGVSDLRRSYESPLWLLLATTTLVLLIACANLANLMLARATAREREIAVRLAIGASRGRIVRQLLAESVLIATAGAAAGAVMAQWLSRVLVASLTTGDERVFVEVSADWRVFTFVALLATSACVIFGLVPSLRATAAGPGPALKAGGRGATDSRERFGLRRLLVVAQVALSLVLVVGALLFARSLRNLASVDAGFRSDAVLVTTLDFRRSGIPEDRLQATFIELLNRLRQRPEIEEAVQVRVVPVSGNFSNRNITIDGVKRKENVNRNVVSDRYFQTMRTPLVAGRDFASRDVMTAPKVAIVTESFARVFFAGQNPIGRTFQTEESADQPRPEFEIVGLAHDSKYGDVRDPFEPLMYIPNTQDEQIAAVLRLLVRSRLPMASVTSAIAAIAHDVQPAIVVNFRSMDAQMRDSLLRERLIATLSGFFGALATLIAVIGLYGVMSYSVARRRNEIGIRLALGAGRGEVVRMVMREAGLLLGAGVFVGTLLTLAAGRAAGALLFGLTPNDPATIVAAIVGLSLVVALASYVPARRAAGVEPAIALRPE